MTDALLAFGLLFSTTTQLRWHGGAVGPGVIAVVLWMIAISFRIWRGGSRADVGPAFVLLAFWSAMALAMSIGMMSAVGTGARLDLGLVLHDVAAYALVAAMSILYGAAPLSGRRVCWMLVGGAALSLSLQLLNASGAIRIPGVDPWYWSRLRGWSDNPNQLAIGCLVVALLAWHLADTASRLAARIAAVACLIPPLIAGRMSQSDTFFIAVTAALPVWFGVKLIVWMKDTRPGRSFRGAVARLILVSIPLLIVSVAPLVMTHAVDVETFAMGFLKKGGAEADGEMMLREDLWHQALERGIESGMLGLGPGPHLQMPAEIAAAHADDAAPPPDVSFPPQNGTANYEAHNTFLDVFVQGGLLAVVSLLGLMMRALKVAYRAAAAGFVSMLTSVAIFMTTGNIIRQPLFWFAVVLCLTASEGMSALQGVPRERTKTRGGMTGRAGEAAG